MPSDRLLFPHIFLRPHIFPSSLSLFKQEQEPSGNGDREAIVVGAGLCDGEGERAYTVYGSTLGGESTQNILNAFDCFAGAKT